MCKNHQNCYHFSNYKEHKDKLYKLPHHKLQRGRKGHKLGLLCTKYTQSVNVCLLHLLHHQGTADLILATLSAQVRNRTSRTELTDQVCVVFVCYVEEGTLSVTGSLASVVFFVVTFIA